MERVQLNNTTLEYEVWGHGEPVLLIHGAIYADAYVPLRGEPTLTSRYRLINYHRRGFAGSDRPSLPTSITQQAADCRAILLTLGVERAHVVGHSYGGAVALQLALDAPDAVHSLVLLEPALLDVPSAPQLVEAVGTAVQLYTEGKGAEAIDAFLRGVVNPNYRQTLKNLPSGAEAQSLADVDTFFQADLPSVQAWSFTAEDAARVTQPALCVLGALSDSVYPGFGEGYRLQQEWLPRAEGVVIPDATHMLQMENPRGVAEAMAGFFARHPMPVTA